MRLVMQNDIQQRAVDFQVTVVINQAQLSKFVHEEATRPRVVPIISASVSWLIFAAMGSGRPSLPKNYSKRSRAKRSVELNS